MATNAIFSGNSRFATDFQATIDRAIAIASLPLTQLNNQKSALDTQSKALTSLDTVFTSFQNAIKALETSSIQGLLSSSVSDGTIVKANVSTGALAGAYSVEVVNLGSFTNTLSKDALPDVTNPATTSISTATSYTLVVDGVSFAIAPTSNNLTSLADAINAKDGVDVDATIVNIGTSANPDYRLSLTSTKLKASTIQLNDGTQDLLDTLATGAAGTYRVNGQPTTPISTESRNVTLAPGITVDLLKVGTASITVSKSTTNISNSLSSFVTAFNAAVDELDKHRGQSKGALSGQSIITSLAQSLRDIGNYTGSTSDNITSLAGLGLTFDDKGKLSFNTATFATATTGQIDNLLTFLGSSTVSGFLKTSLDTLNGIEDSTTGLLKTAITNTTQQIAEQDKRIEENQRRVDQLKESLSAQMAAADALIASLEQKVKYFDTLFETMRINANRAG